MAYLYYIPLNIIISDDLSGVKRTQHDVVD